LFGHLPIRSIESLCWLVSNNYSETKNQRLDILYARYNNNLASHDECRNAALSKLKLHVYKTKAATIL